MKADKSLVAVEVQPPLLSGESGTSAAWSQAGLSLAALQTVGLSAGRATSLCCSQVLGEIRSKNSCEARSVTLL